VYINYQDTTPETGGESYGDVGAITVPDVSALTARFEANLQPIGTRAEMRSIAQRTLEQYG
jgi:hypothetical protein